MSCNSPVLGVAIPLFKLNLTIKRVCNNLQLFDSDTLSHLQHDVSYWEATIALGQERSTIQRSLCDDTTLLYILIVSLLTEQLEEHANHGGQAPPQTLPSTNDNWKEYLRF